MRLLRLLGALALAGSLAGACTAVQNPATGETDYTSLTPEDEAEMGRDEHPKVLAQYGGAYGDRRIQAYVEDVGQRVAAVSDLPELDYTFTVLDSDVVNAFALPGGFVYISRGLLALADNEAELAGVLAHEIGHVTARHTAQRYDRAQLGQLGALGATLLGGIVLGEAGARLGQQVGGLGANAWVQGYSREQEFEADELGVRYLARAGYDPQAMTTFLEALQANDELQRQLTGRSEPGGLASWFASHPRTVDRVERAASEAEAAVPTDEVLDREDFLAAIDGLIYGDDPAQGIVRGRTFEHPDLRLRFTAPEGFRLQNTPRAVLAGDSRGRRIVFDMARASTRDPAAYLEREWGRDVELSDLQRIRSPAGEGALALAVVPVQGQRIPAALATLADAGDRMLRFVLLDTGGRLDRSDLAALQEMLGSVEPLSDAEAAAIRPTVVEVVTVRTGDTVDSLAARMEVERAPRETFIVLNDLDRRPLEPGQQVKIVRRA